MGSESASVVRGIYEAFGRGDVPAVLGAMTEDIEWNEAEGMPYGGVYRGPQAVAENVFGPVIADLPDFSVTLEDLCGTSRSRTLVTARQIAMYLCRELTELSLPKIGQQFGGRDHTTVMHAERKIKQQMAERRSTYNQVTELTNRIKKQAGA